MTSARLRPLVLSFAASLLVFAFGCDSAAPNDVCALPGNSDALSIAQQGAQSFGMDWDVSPIRSFKGTKNRTSVTLSTSELAVDYDARTFEVRLEGPYEDGSGRDTLRVVGSFERSGSLARFRVTDGPTYEGAFMGPTSDFGSVLIDFNEFATDYDAVGLALGSLTTMVFNASGSAPSREITGTLPLNVTFDGVGLPITRPTCMSGQCRRTFESATLTFRPDGTVRSELTHYPEGKPDEKVTDIATARYAAAPNFLALRVGDALQFGEAEDGLSFTSGLSFRSGVYLNSGYGLPSEYTLSATSTIIPPPLVPCAE